MMKTFIFFWILLGVIGAIALYHIVKEYIRWRFDKDIFKKSIIPYTKFLYEDGNIYYFRVIVSQRSNNYHYLKCYKKTKLGMYKQIGDHELISTELGTKRIKKEIKQIMSGYISRLGDDWDGVVGDVPDWVKREERFKKIFKDK